MKDLLKSIILEFQQRELPPLSKRNLTVKTSLPVIITLIGARRSGKTFLLYQAIGELVAGGVSRDNILYINFEDERLVFKTQDLDLILQAFSELYPDKRLDDCYFFFDEIQNIDGWEKFVRRIFDNYSKHIFITGSNSRLLSTEIADALRGRTMTYTVYPLSFKEYLQFKGVEYDVVHPRKKAKVIHNSLEFINQGGFPELIHFDSEDRIRVLQGYFNSMIFRDIVERYKINDVHLLKFFIKKLFANVGKPLSINKIYHDLRSMGYKVSNNYLYEFEQHCQSVFLSISVPKYAFSEIKQAKSDKKLYAIDNGLMASVEFSMSGNRGKLLENAVLTELIKAGYETWYFREKYECDFIIRKNGDIQVMQVSWDLDDPDTQNREIRALVEACQMLKLPGALLITFDLKKNIQAEGIDIQVLPFYEWVQSTDCTD